MLNNQLILSFSHNRWHEKWSEKQSILSGFAAAGNHAVLVEHPFDARTVLRGQVGPVSPGMHQIADRLYHFVPPKWLPKFHPRQKALNDFTRGARVRMLKRAVRRLVGKRRPLVYVWHPDFLEMIGAFDELGVIYHKFDRYPITGEPSPELIRRETECIDRSHVQVAISRQIIAMDPMFGGFEFVPNGAEFEAFHSAMQARPGNEPADLAAIPRPRIGYVGAINQKIDFGLLNHITAEMPDASLVLIGPEVGGESATPEARELKRRPNAHFLGLKAFDELPHYVANLDVGTIVNTKEKAEWVEFCYPLKLHEYLACGLPVVSTDIPSVREFESVVRIALDRDGWVRALREAISDQSDRAREPRIAIGRQNSWSGRIERISQLIHESIPAARNGG